MDYKTYISIKTNPEIIEELRNNIPMLNQAIFRDGTIKDDISITDWQDIESQVISMSQEYDCPVEIQGAGDNLTDHWKIFVDGDDVFLLKGKISFPDINDIQLLS